MHLSIFHSSFWSAHILPFLYFIFYACPNQVWLSGWILGRHGLSVSGHNSCESYEDIIYCACAIEFYFLHMLMKHSHIFCSHLLKSSIIPYPRIVQVEILVFLWMEGSFINKIWICFLAGDSQLLAINHILLTFLGEFFMRPLVKS